jgi:hypothetical protein
MHSWVRRVKNKRAALALAMLAAACSHSKAPPTLGPGGLGVMSGDLGPVGSARSPVSPSAVEFLFSSLDDRPVSSSGLAGKPTVLAFVVTDELASQAQAGFLAAMAKNDGDKVNYALVAVEPAERRELIESFRSFFETKFGVSLRTGMADKDLLLGAGPFGDVRKLTVVLLDKAGKIAWQKTGIAKAEEIRAALARL